MIDWKPVETQPRDGQLVLFWAPKCGCFIAPSAEEIPEEKIKQAHKQIYISDGTWPDHGFTSTHWAPLPEPPRVDTQEE